MNHSEFGGYSYFPFEKQITVVREKLVHHGSAREAGAPGNPAYEKGKEAPASGAVYIPELQI